MQHFDRTGLASRERPSGVYRNEGYRPPRHITRDGASLRMVAAMAEPFQAAARSLFEDEGVEIPLTPFTGEARESDARYYERRSKEECRAAGEAAVPEARAAHQALADLYARLSRRALRRGDARVQGRSAARNRVANMLSERFGRSRSAPGRLAAPYAFRPMEGTEATSRI